MTRLVVKPVTSERWPDLATLFGPNGAYSGCWCMFLRVPSKAFNEQCAAGGAANRAALKRLVESGDEPGLLAYRGAEPVGWVAVSPREALGRVLRSPIHRPIDELDGVYSVSCFFISKSARGAGVADALLAAAIRFSRRRGARALEGYPSDVGDARRPAADMWRGSLRQFERAGFEVVARRKPARPIVRLML